MHHDTGQSASFKDLPANIGEILRKYESDTDKLVQAFFQIKNKSGELVPFTYNRPQRLHAERSSAFDFALKARKLGISSRRIARDLWLCATRKYQHRIMLTHTRDSADKMMSERVMPFIAHCQFPLNAVTRQDYIFFPTTESRYYVGSAGSKKFGRSDDITGRHFSEYAHWQSPEVVTGVNEALVDNADGLIETTANGHNFAKADWTAAKLGRSKERAIFLPWWSDEDYALDPASEPGVITEEEQMLMTEFGLTPEQIAWRRWKKRTMRDPALFPQEYPECITGDMRVCTERGIIPISECRDTHSVDGQQASTVFDKGKKIILKIETVNGRILRGSENHPVGLGGGKFVFLKNLKAGDEVELVPASFSKEYFILEWEDFGVKHEIKIDERWGRFLGYFMGDGSFGQGNLTFVCDKKDIDVILDIERLGKEIFGIDFTKRTVGSKNGGVELRFYSAKFKDIFYRLGILKERCFKRKELVRKVCVPECIWRSSKSVVKEFLSALFECDGCAYSYCPQVKFFSKYKDFIVDVNFLLTGFGINGKVSSVSKNAFGKTYLGNDLTLGAMNSKMFYENIDFISSRKKSGFRWKEKRVGVKAREITFKDEVKSISLEPEEEVYDITIPDKHCFGANGILVHNTDEQAFISSGRPVFDWLALTRYRQVICDPRMCGYLLRRRDRIEFVDDKDGPLRIWRHPEARHVYAIGSDVAEGLRDGAFSTGEVLDVGDGEQVAEWHGHCLPDVLADVLELLSAWYNQAVIIPESWPGPGEVTCSHLIDARANVWQQLDGSRYGWETNRSTKTAMIADLNAALRDREITIRSPELLDELHAFVYDDKMAMGPSLGNFSDRLMGMAIVWHCTRDIAERTDYYRAVKPSIAGQVLRGENTSVPKWQGPMQGRRDE